MKQFVITQAMGKRLIAKAVAARQDVRDAMSSCRLVVIAGTTNAYVAQEVLAAAGIDEELDWEAFRRGTVTPPGAKQPARGTFPGDVVLVGGELQKGKEIFDIASELTTGDVVIKGANAVNLERAEAGVLIGDPECGTAGALLPAVVGRRVKLIVPVGLEKRVEDSIPAIAELLNDPESTGPRMLPLPGEVVTELHALEELTGVDAAIIAGGGVCGAQGAVWLAVTGTDEEITAAAELIAALVGEPDWPELKKI